MALQRGMPHAPSSFAFLWILILSLSAFLRTVIAEEIVLIKGNGIDGVSRELDVSRTPALYTGDFDDCLGGESLFNVTKFDAAYYADNLTVLFHLDGTTNIRRENLVCELPDLSSCLRPC
jgi:hypothetical protein